MRWALLAMLSGLLGCDEVTIVGDAPLHDALKGDRDGLAWLSLSSAPAPSEGLAVAEFPDQQGSVVTGFSTSRDALGRPHRDIWVAALDAEGREVWSESVDFAGKDDQGFDIAVNSQHEVYAGGSVTDADGVTRAWLRKWSPRGDVLSTVVAEPGGDLRIKSLLPWEADVIVTGYANTFEVGRDVTIQRRDGASLAELWSTRYDGPLHGEDEPNRIAIWRSSPIWVAGYQQSAIGGGSNPSLLELRPDGMLTWQRSLMNTDGTSLNGEWHGIAVDDLDNTYYLCGSLLESNPTRETAAVFKLGYHDERQWQAALSDVLDVPSSLDTPTDVAAKACSLRSGTLSVAGTATEGGKSQFWAAKFDPAGQRLWLRKPAELATGNSAAALLDGSALVTGQATDGRLFVAKLLP